MVFLRHLAGAAAATLILSACGGAEESPAATPTAPQTTEETPDTTDAPAEAPVEFAEKPEFAPEFAALREPYKSADYDRGKRTYRLCQSCHTLAEGGPNLVGPNLYGVFGRQVGGVDGFRYSSAVEEADFIWTPELLNEWLVSPRNFLPGNNMSFAGVRREEDRLGVIAYIMAETGYASQE